MNCGVYMIKNKTTGKVYIGSSKVLSKRFYAHRRALTVGKHHSVKLQHSWNKYGSELFDFSVLLLCSPENRVMYEQICIDHYGSHKNGYNILPKAGTTEGRKATDEQKAKMSQLQRALNSNYEWKGKKRSLVEIAEMENFDPNLLQARVVEYGHTVERALSYPKQEWNRKYTAFGKSRTAKEWAEVLAVQESTFRGWLDRFSSTEDAISHAKKWNSFELSRTLGADPNTVAARLRLGWSMGDALTVPARKFFTQEDAKEIRELSKTLRVVDLAKKYNVHVDTISLIVNNKSFKEAA